MNKILKKQKFNSIYKEISEFAVVVCLGIILGIFLFEFLFQGIHYLYYLYYLYSKYGFIIIIISIMIVFVCIEIFSILKYLIYRDSEFLEKVSSILLFGFCSLGLIALLMIIFSFLRTLM